MTRPVGTQCLFASKHVPGVTQRLNSKQACCPYGAINYLLLCLTNIGPLRGLLLVKMFDDLSLGLRIPFPPSLGPRGTLWL